MRSKRLWIEQYQWSRQQPRHQRPKRKHQQPKEAARILVTESLMPGARKWPAAVWWDDGLDVPQLRIAFLEMAESGVIMDGVHNKSSKSGGRGSGGRSSRSKHDDSLSLHLSRSQHKPFVHNCHTNQSIFLDEVVGVCFAKAILIQWTFFAWIDSHCCPYIQLFHQFNHLRRA